MFIECPHCGYENAQWEILDVVEGKGYIWVTRCDECNWEDAGYEF